MLSIEQIRPELTWRLRREVLYPNEQLAHMAMEEDNHGYHFGQMYNRLYPFFNIFCFNYLSSLHLRQLLLAYNYRIM